MLRVRCVGMDMWARPGASNGASTHRSAQASRTRSGMRYIHTHTHTAHEYLLPSTCLSSGLRAFTRLCFPTHACVAFVPIVSVMILPRLHADRVLRVIPACLVCVDLLRLSRVSGLLGVPG